MPLHLVVVIPIDDPHMMLPFLYDTEIGHFSGLLLLAFNKSATPEVEITIRIFDFDIRINRQTEARKCRSESKSVEQAKRVAAVARNHRNSLLKWNGRKWPEGEIFGFNGMDPLLSLP